jgi:hypothetical protein
MRHAGMVLLPTQQAGRNVAAPHVVACCMPHGSCRLKSNQINVTPVAMKLKKLMPAIH